MTNPAGKVAVVTGSSRGIGLGIAKALLEAGARVAICSRNQQQIDAATSQLGYAADQLIGCRADVSCEDDVQSLFRKTIDAFGRVDIVVNNAGNFDGGPIENLTLADWNNVLGACLTGPFLCTREAFRYMKPQRSGRILNIGSISAQRARLYTVPYTSSKFGVQGLTQAAALEGREHGIIVSALHPGNVLVERRADSVAEMDTEPMMATETIVRAAMTMLTMPDDVNFLEAIVLPNQQLYIGRG